MLFAPSARALQKTPAPFLVMLMDLWRSRHFLFAGCVMGFCCALVFIMVAVPYRQAHMVLIPASSLESAGRSLAGVSEGGAIMPSETSGPSASQNFQQFQAMTHGAAVASLLLRSSDMMHGISSEKSTRFSKPEGGWTPEKLAEYIEKRVLFSSVGETPMREMAYRHPDPKFAAAFLARLHTVTDSLIRYNVRKAVEGRIAYLQDALSRTMNPDHRRAVTALLMEQERLKMLVSIDQPYAATIVEPAFFSSKPVWPDKALVFSVFCGAGLFLGFMMFQIREALRVSVVRTPSLPAQRFEAPQTMKTRLEGFRPWHKTKGENNNQRPLTGGRSNKPDSSSDAAE